MEAFANTSDASRALNNSILFYQNEPYYFKWYDGNTFTIYPVGNSDVSSKRVDYRSPDVSDKIPPLGYINLEPKANYITRDPVSERRAGLPTASLRQHDGKPLDYLAGGLYIWQQQALADMLMNKYPSLKEAMDMLSPERYLIAFHKHYAVGADKRIYHRDKFICQLQPNSITGKYEAVYNDDLRKPSLIMKRFNELFLETIRDIEA